MAASDPTPYVATPTGVLQGVAAFSWDGSAWTPGGRAGPGVPTPTGVLQGVAPFSWDGAGWQPAGRAGPGVATPTGTLDGVAVYTWSGSAWTPPGGTETPPTPTGVLRGVAAFSWDGYAWQPASQARPSVPTPYGVLDGVAMFNWSGTTWAAGAAVPSGATLDLSFLSGTLDPRITFTRASSATYFDSSGTMQSAATNAPRFDYNPVSLQLRGLLIEEARTNVALNSSNPAAASWGGSSITVAAPTITGGQVTAPDGTLSAARVVYPAVPAAGNASLLNVNGPGTGGSVAVYSFSVWLRGNVGGEQVYLSTTPNGTTFFSQLATLTTSWQRFVLVTGNLTAVGWFFAIGTDRRDASQSATSAQTIFVWGAQIEVGAFPTSYIPTTSAAVTRAAEAASMSTAGWFNAATGTLAADCSTMVVALAGNYDIVGFNTGAQTDTILMRIASLATVVTAAAFSANTSRGGPNSGGALVVGVPFKAAMTYDTAGLSETVCLNGTTPVTAATTGMPGGLTTLVFGPARVGPGMSGYYRRVRYWPRVLSNAEMQSVTT